MKPKVTPEMKLGMREFENTMFMLKAIPCEESINRFALQGNLNPERLDNIAWFLPAYLSADFNLFFIFAPNVNNRWAISCSQGIALSINMVFSNSLIPNFISGVTLGFISSKIS